MDFSTIQQIMQFFTSGAWVDYAIVIGFTLVALFLVIKFMDNGPKKILAIFSVVGLGFVGVFLTRRRNKYTEKLLREENKKIDKLQEIVENRNKIIEKRNEEITRLEQERAQLRPEIDADKNEIDKLDLKILNSKIEYDKIKQSIERQESQIAADFSSSSSESPIRSAAEILAEYDLIGKRPATTSIVPDPAGPTPDAEDNVVFNGVSKNNEIVINGFRLKGDV